MHHLYSIIALDIAHDRVLEAQEAHRAALAREARPSGPNVVRRGLANGFALVSRGSAAATRRLDDCVADDLSRALAAGK